MANKALPIPRIAGKGHSWPKSAIPARITTRDLDVTDVIWDFFAARPKPV